MRLAVLLAAILSIGPAYAGKTVSGLIAQDDFTTLSAWTPGTGWAADGSFPTYIAYPSSVPLVVIGTGSASDSSGPRDAITLITASTGVWNIYYDAGVAAGSSCPTAAWTPQIATSTNRGLTITKHGTLPGVTAGSFAARGVGGSMIWSGGTGYIGILDAPSITCGIPTGNYTGGPWSFTSPAGTYTLVTANTPGTCTTGSFCDGENVLSWENLVSGTYHVYTSAKSGSTFNVGHATGSAIGGPFTMDGLGPFIPSGISDNPENPKYWFDPTLNRYVICANGIQGGAPVGNDCYFSTSGTSFSVGYRYAIQNLTSPFDGFGGNAIGLFAPMTDDSNNVIMSGGFLPFTFDSNAPTSFNGGGNPVGYALGRNVYQGVLEPAVSAASFTGSSASNMVQSLGNSDFEAEFGIEVPNGSTSGNAGFTYRRSSTAGDSTNGYYASVTFNSNSSGTSYVWSIQTITSGAFGTLASGTDTSMYRDGAIGNYIIARVRVSVHGSTHSIYVNGNSVPVATATDATYSSGASISFRATQPVRFQHFSMRTGNNVAVAGAGAASTVTLRGYGGVVLNTTTADGTGAATLTNVHFPAYSIDVNGTDQATGGVWGGDNWNFGAAPAAAGGGRRGFGR